MEAYRYPEYCDIAFAVADAAREVDFFEAAIRRFSRTPVRRVFEIACGTAPYLAEWQRRDYRRSWTRRRGGITVRMTYRAELIDPIAQTYHECVTLDVDDHGTVHKIEGRVPTKIFFPQEFLCLVESSRHFEFVGWFNDFEL